MIDHPKYLSEDDCSPSCLNSYEIIEKSLKKIEKRKLSVTFTNNLWSIFDNRGEVASSNTLIEAIKKV